jgi:flagellar assembly protein FliH
LPNILKNFAHVAAELYHFPTEEDLALEDELLAAAKKKAEPEPETEPESAPEGEELSEDPLLLEDELPPEELKIDSPVEYARIQADIILRKARIEAEDIIAEARKKAEEETKAVCAAAQEAGRREGYVDGVAKAEAEGKKRREEQAAALEEEVKRFLEQASERVDGAMDAQVDELRDLAIAVAEKVVCISLKSSSEVIGRMIQTAIDKRKRKEWVRIYISECDAKKMAQVPQSLSSALSALSDRVRIIPVADDEPGTCIIEMPDEIVDASASTQLNNLRSMLMDLPGGGENR